MNSVLPATAARDSSSDAANDFLVGHASCSCEHSQANASQYLLSALPLRAGAVIPARSHNQFGHYSALMTRRQSRCPAQGQ